MFALRSLALVLTALSFAPGPARAQSMAPGFGDVELSGAAGGPVRATRYGNTPDGLCTGWVAAEPSHTITLDAPIATLTFAVSAPADTTLVIVGPSATRCSDDVGADPNPRLSGSFPAGTYRIYVGAYDEGQVVRYTLTISE